MAEDADAAVAPLGDLPPTGHAHAEADSDCKMNPTSIFDDPIYSPGATGMPCYQPTRVVMKGDHRLHFETDWKFAKYLDGETVVLVPCRACIGCNQATAREWSVRSFHEAQLHSQDWKDEDTGITTAIPNNSVITLTYNPEHLPADGCLNHDDFQRFMKRLRIRRQRRHKSSGLTGPCKPIRMFMCGEYGGKTARPHFHAVIFGETFDDRYETRDMSGQIQKHSYELDELWTQSPPGTDLPPTNIGRATVDDYSFAGASYVAGYVAKRSSTLGSQGPTKTRIDPAGTKWITPVAPEYRKMSTHPGIGAPWIEIWDNMARVYSDDCIRIKEWTFHPPSYYDRLLNRTRPDLMQDIIANRHQGMSKIAEEWSPERCAAAEQIALLALQQRRDSL